MDKTAREKLMAEVRRKLWDEDRMSDEEASELANRCYYQYFDITYDLDYSSRYDV